MKLETVLQIQAQKRVSVRRINNPAAFGGPEVYETRDPEGKLDKEFRDREGAEIRKRKLDRRKFRLGKGSKSLRKSEDLKYGRKHSDDDSLRNTTGGTGGAGGPGAGNG